MTFYVFSAGTCNCASGGATRAVNSRYCGPFLNPISLQAASSTICGKHHIKVLINPLTYLDDNIICFLF